MNEIAAMNRQGTFAMFADTTKPMSRDDLEYICCRAGFSFIPPRDIEALKHVVAFFLSGRNSALAHCFIWSRTSEGEHYWRSIAESELPARGHARQFALSLLRGLAVYPKRDPVPDTRLKW